MHPPLSIVFFTVLSGAGLGLSIAAGLFAARLPPDSVIAVAAVALALVGGGLSLSVAHLANPKNAWRAFMRARTSWLSREAIAAVLYFITLLCWWRFPDHLAARAALITVAAVTIICTAMIYQSLKPMPQWHHPLTTYNYLALALAAGGIWLIAILLFFPADSAALAPIRLFAVAALVAALIGKIAHYRRISRIADTSTTRAIGYSQAHARLLDAGHTGPTFLTREFIAPANARRLAVLRVVSTALWLLAGLAAVAAPVATAAVAAAALTLAGVLIERYLFFAEARHTIRAYH